MAGRRLLLVLERCATFSAANAHARNLVLHFGPGPLVQRADSGFAILAPPSYISRIGAAESRRPAERVAAAPSRLARQLEPVPRARALERTKTSPSVGRILAKPARNVPAKRSPGNPVAVAAPVVSAPFDSARLRRMVSELKHAYRNMPPAEAKQWTARLLKRFGSTFARRVGNLVDLSAFVLEAAGGELIDASRALWRGRGAEYASRRYSDLSGATLAAVERGGASARKLVVAFKAKPGEVGSGLMVAALAFYVGSGGFDGDGGAPDLDIDLFGIGGHRSIFTHSIVTGAVVETSLFGLVDFVGTSHQYLPDGHDPLWDEIRQRSVAIAGQAVRGASAGLAYHLAVDSLLQPGTYKDLPFSAPLEIHQAIAGASAASEGVEATRSKGVDPRAGADQAPRGGEAMRVAKMAVGGAVALTAWLLGAA